MEPIPSYLLNMTASHEQSTGVDGYGDPTYAEAVPISKVYIEWTRAASGGSFGDRQRYDAILFYDALHSLPAGRSFSELDRITFSGKVHLVRSIAETRDPFSGDLVFLEVRLAGS